MKLRNVIIACIVMILSSASVALAQKAKKAKNIKTTAPKDAVKEIHWASGKEPDFEDTVRKTKKPAFVYIYINGWDEVAKFNQNVLEDSNIVNFVDSNFMAYKVDMEYDSPNGIKFMIDKVPAVILLDQDGKAMANIQGYKDPKEFKKFLKQRLGK